MKERHNTPNRPQNRPMPGRARPMLPIGSSRPPLKPAQGGEGAPQRKGKGRPPKPIDKGPSPARKLALETLLDVETGGAYVQLALDKRLTAARLPDNDRRLATELVYGTLENKMRLDWLFTKVMERPMDDTVVKNVLRMGCYQLIFLDRIPDNAAVTESVELARTFGRVELTSLVNGVLRSIARLRDSEAGIPWPGDETPTLERLSILYSIPQWLMQRLIEEYGDEVAERIVSYRPDERMVTVRPNLLRMDEDAYAEHLEKSGITFTRGLLPYAFHVKGGAPSTDFVKGIHSIQGEGSMIAAQAVGVRNGWHVLDACAAPGGKTLLMSELMHGTGRVHAWDMHPHRVELINASVQREGLDNVRPRVQDATFYREDMEKLMDAVLVDAPCSGYGVMLGKPDVKYRHVPGDIESIAVLQERILSTCANYVKPGGVLVYSTCTLLRRENGDVIHAFLEAHPDFRCEGLAERLPEPLREHVRDGMIQMLPYRDGVEGFFVCRMVRAK